DVYARAMRIMVVSEFEARCSAVLKEVQRSGEPLVITLRGKPLATVRPLEPSGPGKLLGGLKGKMTIRRDLVKVDTTPDWEILRFSTASSSDLPVVGLTRTSTPASRAGSGARGRRSRWA